ncbi:hypothetical protein CARUB_v10010565mg [Capsella rubella]|uniref:Uncharacterized protein n=1 Tax=Capsella rubella TaxID=81985 RepID=R0IJP9_9BRAS|nr:hypothetical protein CARUB_v10010565mg [Capsella rubella]
MHYPSKVFSLLSYDSPKSFPFCLMILLIPSLKTLWFYSLFFLKFIPFQSLLTRLSGFEPSYSAGRFYHPTNYNFFYLLYFACTTYPKSFIFCLMILLNPSLRTFGSFMSFFLRLILIQSRLTLNLITFPNMHALPSQQFSSNVICFLS